MGRAGLHRLQAGERHGRAGPGAALRGLVHLTQVELRFYGCKVSDTGVQALAQALQGLVKLTEVTLWFGARSQVSAGAMERLKTSLQDRVKSLYIT